jgi:hypothetical protein
MLCQSWWRLLKQEPIREQTLDAIARHENCRSLQELAWATALSNVTTDRRSVKSYSGGDAHS